MNDNNKIHSNDKWVGSFVGLTIGDQRGSLVEGKPRGSFDRVTGMADGSFWTDDTSQALCIADSLISTKELDLYDQLEKVEKVILDDLSMFDLDLENPVSEQTAKEMTMIDYNSYQYHRKFDGKLQLHRTRNGPQNPPYCPVSPGQLYHLFLVYLTNICSENML